MQPSQPLHEHESESFKQAIALKFLHLTSQAIPKRMMANAMSVHATLHDAWGEEIDQAEQYKK
jgi:hypothetical protein